MDYIGAKMDNDYTDLKETESVGMVLGFLGPVIILVAAVAFVAIGFLAAIG